MKTKIYQFSLITLIITLISLGVTELFKMTEIATVNAKTKAVNYITGPLPDYNVYVPRKSDDEKEFEYNERVPEDVILEEMHVLAERFNINSNKWEKVLRCESTCTKREADEGICEPKKLNNLAQNNTSTAVGLGQYLIRTWYETESWKQYKKARTDYKASLWEMALDIKNGEQWRWQECLDITGVNF